VQNALHRPGRLPEDSDLVDVGALDRVECLQRLGEDRQCLGQVLVAVRLNRLGFLRQLMGACLLGLNLGLPRGHHMRRLLLNLLHQEVSLAGRLHEPGLLLLQVLPHFLHLCGRKQQFLDSALISGS
jgi:hypothetical protein